MADKTSSKTDSKATRTGSNLGSHPDGIDPSAPSVGTAGWGTTSDERNAISRPDAGATRAGQMKGNLGDDMTTASQAASEQATTNKRRSEDSADSHADLSSRTSGSSHSLNTSHAGSQHSFRCADAGSAACKWETTGRSEEEVMEKVVEHSRADHGMSDWTDAMRDRVRGAIRHRQAA